MSNGKTLLYMLRERLNEAEDSEFLRDRLSYSLLNAAAEELVSRTSCLHDIATITTVAGQQEYILPSDFLAIMVSDTQNSRFVQFQYMGMTSKVNVNEGDYSDMKSIGAVPAARVPGRFCILDYVNTPARLDGTVQATSTSADGECTLTASAGFTSLLAANVSIGDIVHNVTSGADGFVIDKPTPLTLLTCLFDGSRTGWQIGDRFIVQPQGRMSIYFDRPLTNSGDTILIDYLQRPEPVYSPYRAFRIPQQQISNLVDFAAQYYKYRDRNPKFGDEFGTKYDNSVRRAGRDQRRARSSSGMAVNFKVQKR